MKNVAVISLGCDKNRVDTEHMLYRISRGGYAISDIADADVIIVNTCAFIESASQESIDTILSCAELKKTGKCEKLIVTGCLPQRYGEELKKELPEVDAFLGAFEYEKIVAEIDGAEEKIEKQDFDAAENEARLLTTYPHVAYIKIAEGCNNKCTFCTIPSIRGRYRSRHVADIVKEAEQLVADGVKELILVAQDVTRFGVDRGKYEITELLTELEKLPVYKIRLLYCYPEAVSDGLIDKIATSDKIAKYIDIPLQHASDAVLKLMGRKTTGEAAEKLINKLHDKGITVRTTFMVGFPGETENEFDELVSFVSRVKPEYAGIFAYSEEDGTPAAKLKGKVTKKEKSRRVNVLGKACEAVTREFNENMVGKDIRVIYEDIDYDKNMFTGRAEFQSPEVDGRVYFGSATPVDAGNTYTVRITKSDNYDLYGDVIDGRE